MENNIKKLKVTVIEREHEGRKFNVYQTYSKNGRKTELKFRKEVNNVPTKNCYIEVLAKNISLNTSGEFPVCWVHAIENIISLEESTAETNLKKVEEYFG